MALMLSGVATRRRIRPMPPGWALKQTGMASVRAIVSAASFEVATGGL
jgi:hypothetical protein